MPESGVFVPEDGDLVQLKPEREKRARMGWVNIGVHAVQLMLDRDGNLTVEANARCNEDAPIQSLKVSYQEAVDAGGVDPDYNWVMTDPNKLLAHLVAKYPVLQPHFVDKSTTAFANNLAMPHQLIEIVVDGEEIIDPFMSECGRFDVNPDNAYGISIEDAEFLRDFNCVGQEADEDVEADHPNFF